MKTVRGILLFILAMLLGIILFVVAVGGAIYGVINNVTVGELQDDFVHKEIISPDGQLYGQTILQAIQQVLKDVKDTSNLSFKTLYEHYGLKILNGVEGLDFTTKPFYTAPLKDVLSNPKAILNDLTVNDVSIISKLDFGDYSIPLLTDNLDTGILDFFDTALDTISGDLTVRLIKDQLGIDIGVEDNVMISAVQDVPLTEFGKVINAMYLNTLLQADTDVFVKYGENPVYGKVDIYEEVSIEDLKNQSYIPAIGVETYVCGALEPVNENDVSTLETKELRYIKKVSTEPGSTGEEYYVVDNTCYAEGFNADETEKVFYRHVLYAPYNQLGDKVDEYFVPAYYNKVIDVDGLNFELLSAGFQSLKEIFTKNELDTFITYNLLVDGNTINITNAFVEVEPENPEDTVFVAEQSGEYTILTPDKDSKLQVVELPTAQQKYLRSHKGTTSAVIQAVAHLTVEELQNADSLLDNIKIGEIVDVTQDGTAKILVALKDSTLKTIGKDVNHLTLSQMIDINMTEYELANGTEGKFALVEDETTFILFDKDNEYMQNLARYTKLDDGSFVEDENGKYVHAQYFTLYNPAVHGESVKTYNEKEVQSPDVSSKLLQRFANATMDGINFDGLILADVLDMDTDHYVAVTLEDAQANPQNVYYVYNEENGVYTRWNHTDTNQKLFAVSNAGENSAIIKRLAFAKVNTLADSMEYVMDDLLVNEIIDIYRFSAVEDTNNTSLPEKDENPLDNLNFNAEKYQYTKYFLPKFGDIEVEQKNENGETQIVTRPYTYVYDKSGRYMERDYQLVKVNQLPTQTGTKYYKYEKIVDKFTFIQHSTKGNVYYKATDSNTYVQNLPLIAYLASEGKFDNLYYRVLVDGSSDDAIATSVFDNPTIELNGISIPKYYINVNGQFIPYNPEYNYSLDNPLMPDGIAHLDTDYYELQVGTCYVSISATGLDDSYKYIEDVDAKLAKKYCDDVYFKESDGKYVYINGFYVEFNPDIHSNQDRFNKYTGYVASFGETFTGNAENGYKTTLTGWKRVTAIREQSVPVMRLFANSTLNNLNDVVKNATLNNIMDIEPGSIMSKFEDATLLNFDDTIAEILPTLSLGDLLEWSAITTVDQAVVNALKDVGLTQFFNSLTYSPEKGIYIDMEKVYQKN